MAIGFELDDDDATDEPETQVVDGHASYTADDVANYAAMLELAYRALAGCASWVPSSSR